MRWERLFDDLESQLEAAEHEEFAAEVADRTRREVALVRLADRLRAGRGGSVEVAVAGAGVLRGDLRRCGPGWLLLVDDAGHDLLINAAAVLAVRGLPGAGSDPAHPDSLEARLELGHVLRGIARDRATVTVVLRDGSHIVGTIDRVGADFLDVAEHPHDEPRRPSRVRGLRAVAFAGLAVVRPG